MSASHDAHASANWQYGSLRGYVIERLLGKGAFGSVYRAVQKSTGQEVAVKVLRVHADTDGEVAARQRARFRRETQLLAHLRHPHIVTLLDSLETESGDLCAIFELVPGDTLDDILSREGALSASLTGRLMAQVLDALTCAHAQGIIHRDIKPQNVMITGTGSHPNVKLVDFGIGTFLRVAELKPPSLTRAGEIIGTPAYAAPEQLRGEPATPQSDLYSWGLVVLECLIGVPVMRARSLAELLHRQLSSTDVSLPPGVAAHPLGALLRQVLHKDPRDRVNSAAALYEQFSKLRLDDLVGPLTELDRTSVREAPPATQDTLENWEGRHQAAKRVPVTVMSWSLDLVSARDDQDMETTEALARDQLSLCKDTVSRFGGFLAGVLGNRAVAYFGYPHQHDSAARLAALAALELLAQVRRRSIGLEASGLGLELRVGLHTGVILITGKEVPTGQTPNLAMRLEALARPGEILASGATAGLLRAYMALEALEHSAASGKPSPAFRVIGEQSTESFAQVSLRRAPTALLGRERELEILQTRWVASKTGTPNTVMLQGPPGIGKSRLIYELRHWVRGIEGATIYECRCLPEHKNSALHPFLEMVRERLQLSDAHDPAHAVGRVQHALARARCQVEESEAILCSWLSIPGQTGARALPHSPQRQRALLFETLQRLLYGPCVGPALLLLEDVHWADPTTIDFLGQLSKADTPIPVLIVMTTRDESLALWGESNILHLELPALSNDSIRELVVLLASGRKLSKRAMDVIVERSDGVPLFAEELATMLLDRVLEVREGVYDVPEHFDFTSIPITLHDSLAERLDRLGPAAETARIAAAIGREFAHELLVASSTRSAGTVQIDLELLVQAELIVPRRHVEALHYTFRHALVRDAAYESLPRSERRAVHARIAAAITTSFPEIGRVRPAELARHCAEAGEFEDAVQWGTRAVALSLERWAHPETVAQSRVTLGWIPRLPESKQLRREVEIRGLLAQALMAMRGWADGEVRLAIDHSRTLVEKLDTRQDLALILATLYHAFLYHHVASNRRECARLAEQFAALAEPSAERGWLAASATLLGLTLHADGAFERSALALERALQLYDRTDHAHHGSLFGFDSYVWARATLALVRWFSESPEAAYACAEDALLWARQLKHLPSVGIALLYKAIVHQYSGDRAGAKEATEELLGLASTYGLPAFEGYAAVIHGWACGSSTAAREILAALPKMGCRLALHYYGALPAQTDASRGDIENALRQIDECLALCERNEDRALEPELHRWRATFLQDAVPARTPEARRELELAIALSQERGLSRTATLAREALLRLPAGALPELAPQATPAQ